MVGIPDKGVLNVRRSILRVVRIPTRGKPTTLFGRDSAAALPVRRGFSEHAYTPHPSLLAALLPLRACWKGPQTRRRGFGMNVSTVARRGAIRPPATRRPGVGAQGSRRVKTGRCWSSREARVQRLGSAGRRGRFAFRTLGKYFIGKAVAKAMIHDQHEPGDLL